jgi:hypothetical protein
MAICALARIAVARLFFSSSLGPRLLLVDRDDGENVVGCLFLLDRVTKHVTTT